ncbi:hypothetical protein EDB84DRAFT_1440470 [Lactarius hengduanensis]|nr:hypothetical protein EDB84DRAFT_1440470 [Lactarius hengduanensis]
MGEGYVGYVCGRLVGPVEVFRHPHDHAFSKSCLESQIHTGLLDGKHRSSSVVPGLFHNDNLLGIERLRFGRLGRQGGDTGDEEWVQRRGLCRELWKILTSHSFDRGERRRGKFDANEVTGIRKEVIRVEEARPRGKGPCRTPYTVLCATDVSISKKSGHEGNSMTVAWATDDCPVSGRMYCRAQCRGHLSKSSRWYTTGPQSREERHRGKRVGSLPLFLFVRRSFHSGNVSDDLNGELVFTVTPTQAHAVPEIEGEEEELSEDWDAINIVDADSM